MSEGKQASCTRLVLDMFGLGVNQELSTLHLEGLRCHSLGAN